MRFTLRVIRPTFSAIEFRRLTWLLLARNNSKLFVGHMNHEHDSHGATREIVRRPTPLQTILATDIITIVQRY